MSEKKEINPKELLANKKIPLQLIPPEASKQLALALYFGANIKEYGEWNWRTSDPINYMTYVGAIKRHLDFLVERKDMDKESTLNHLGHIMASCAILLDADKYNNINDDRPPIKK